MLAGRVGTHACLHVGVMSTVSGEFSPWLLMARLAACMKAAVRREQNTKAATEWQCQTLWLW
jgi:hypothetical protein